MKSWFYISFEQNGGHFADSILKCIFFLNEKFCILIKVSLKFVPEDAIEAARLTLVFRRHIIKISLKSVPEGPINIIPSLVQIMAWRRPGDKPLSEPMMVRLLMHICVTLPQWVIVSIGSGNGLMLNMQQVITWTNFDRSTDANSSFVILHLMLV